MDAVPVPGRAERSRAGANDDAVLLWVFTLTLFLSALLLFSVQPIFAKMVLPTLGGTPAVWAVSLCFFQAVLLAGYAYAHALNRHLAPRTAPLVHIALLSLAFVVLPFGLPANLSEPPAGNASFWLIGVLTLGVGLPFFAVSANAPLLQSWFARTGHPHGHDPYFLYGASNLGSLVALLAYPVAIEPLVGLSRQASVWTVGFSVLVALIALSGVLMVRRGASEAGERTASEAAQRTVPAASVRDRLAWVALAAVPSGLLVAFTTYVTTDIASAPLLWVIPLAIFLATFILVFRDRPLVSHALMLRVQPVLLVLVMLGMSVGGKASWLLGNVAGLSLFFVTTMVAHKELFDRRPGSAGLTGFYMWMSLGGVLGGLFAALIAPQIFNRVYEYPLLLVLGMLCRPGVVGAHLPTREEAMRLAKGAALALGLLIALALAGAVLGLTAQMKPVQVATVLALGAVLVVVAKCPREQATAAALMLAALLILPSSMSTGEAERSFFGVHRVVTSPDGAVRMLTHGTTLHGAERLKTADGKPVPHPVAATYFYPGGPMARAIDVMRDLRSGAPLKVGIVGLGTGSLGCYAKAGDTWRFFEIDPLVVKIAKDPAKFSYLSRCVPDAPMILGDARLTLAKEPAGALDYLVIDAFASDAVPIHLLTVEAIGLYLDKLAPHGVLALHVSNRHLDLDVVASATAKAVAGTHVALAADTIKNRSVDASASRVVYVTRDAASHAALLKLPFASAITQSAVIPWTDDYSDITTSLWRNARR